MTTSEKVGSNIRKANAESIRRILEAKPVLIDVLPASEAIPALQEGMILHAGPPIDWGKMCGPMRGAVAGIAVFEGWATDLAEAERLADSGAFRLNPNHDFGAVGPMTGMTTYAYTEVGAITAHRGDNAGAFDVRHWIHDRLAQDHGQVEKELVV